MLGGNHRPGDPALGSAPVPSPSLLSTDGGEALPERDPCSLGKSKAQEAKAAFAPWVAGGSFQAALPLPFCS